MKCVRRRKFRRLDFPKQLKKCSKMVRLASESILLMLGKVDFNITTKRLFNVFEKWNL